MMAMLLLTSVFAGCATQAAEQTAGGAFGGKLSVVTTIFPPYDFARAVSGGLADVTMLIDPGAEVHSFDPTTQDIMKIQNCDVFIYIGGENDTWVDTVLDSMDTSNKTIVKLMDAVTPVEEETVEGMQEEEHDHEHAEGEESHEEEGPEYDEHIWTSPKNAMLMVDAIAQAMGSADSKNAGSYTANAADYNAQIKEVDERIQDIVDQAPQKLLVVADRFPFRYFVDEFGLDYSAAFSGCSAESDVSAGTLAYLIDQVKDNNIKYIYYIELSNKQVADAVAEQTGAETLLLHSCHNVTKDDFDAGVTYVSLMTGNADNLEKGLD
jgi:zinc transport system substrate-binding protein